MPNGLSNPALSAIHLVVASDTDKMTEALTLRGTLKGHSDWVTSIATTAEDPSMILSSSRDKTVLIWALTGSSGGGEEGEYGYPRRALKGHSHFVSDVVISSDGQFALSGSWDGTLRLWELATGKTTRRFVGHSKDVLSVAFSTDNRQIVSGSRDNTVKLWNTLGECKYTISDEGHTDWVSCVRFSPSVQAPVIVSCGWDKLVKVWSLNTCKLRTNLHGHTGYLNTVTVSPDGSLCASGGKDGTAMLWDLNEGRRRRLIDNAVLVPMSFWARLWTLYDAARRRQAALQPRRGRRHYVISLLAQPLLALRCYDTLHQNMGSRVQGGRRRAPPRVPSSGQKRADTVLHLHLLVRRWFNSILRLY